MSTKLEIDFHDDSDDQWAHIILRQEGMRGFKLYLTWLPEFLEGLESPNDPNGVCIFKNYHVRNTRTSCTLSISSLEDPLLHLDAGQKTKLIQHLKDQYAYYL